MGGEPSLPRSHDFVDMWPQRQVHDCITRVKDSGDGLNEIEIDLCKMPVWPKTLPGIILKMLSLTPFYLDLGS